MKKTILALLMSVVITIPCFAQEVEPDKLASLDGTLWETYTVGAGLMILYPFFFFATYCSHTGFHNDTLFRSVCEESLFKAYPMDEGKCKVNYTEFNYSDSPYGAIFWNFDTIENENFSFVYQLWTFPISGIGIYLGGIFRVGFIASEIGITFRIDKNWTPPEDEPTTE